MAVVPGAKKRFPIMLIEIEHAIRTPFLKSMSKASIFGHGALTLFLKNPSQYKSVSAFALICNPTECPWGNKAFKGYLERTKPGGRSYHTILLPKNNEGPKSTILIDQGDGDKFYVEKQPLPERFEKPCKSACMRRTAHHSSTPTRL